MLDENQRGSAEFKKTKPMNNPRCELVSGEDVSFLEGKLKTLADATIPKIVGGDSNKQNKAIKDVIQTILWDWFNFITEHNTDHLLEKKKWYSGKKESTNC